METKKIKITKENVSEKAAELKEEDLENIAGGVMSAYRACKECGCDVKIYGNCLDVYCPNCGCFNHFGVKKSSEK